MLYSINIKNKIDGTINNQLVSAENHEEAVRIAMRELGKETEKPYHFIEWKG